MVNKVQNKNQYQRLSTKNIIISLLKALISSLVFYLIYSTSLIRNKYSGFFDILFYLIISNFVGSIISILILFIINLENNRDIMKKYFNSEHIFLIIIEAFISSAFYVTLRTELYPDDFGELIFEIFLILLIVKILSILVLKTLSDTIVHKLKRRLGKTALPIVTITVFVLIIMLKLFI